MLIDFIKNLVLAMCGLSNYSHFLINVTVLLILRSKSWYLMPNAYIVFKAFSNTYYLFETSREYNYSIFFIYHDDFTKEIATLVLFLLCSFYDDNK